MPIRELNTSTKIETAPAPTKPGFRLYHAPRVSGHAGIVLRVTRGRAGGVRRTIQVVTRGPDRREHRAFVSDWPVAEGKTLASTLARACEMRERIKKGLPPYPPDTMEAEIAVPQLCQIWARYLKTHTPDKKPSTASNDERLWRLHIAPSLGNKRPEELTYDVIKRWYRAVAAKSVVNANRSFKLLKAVLNAAKRKWKEPWARENPCDVLGPEDRKQETGRVIVIAREQRAKLIQCIAEHPLSKPAKAGREKDEPNIRTLAMRQSANCLLLIALTGCRKHEALDAKWSEFDLQNGFWNIPATRTKQARSIRIPLLPDALNHVKSLFDKRVSDTLLFPQGGDATKTQDTLKRSWRTIVKRAGLSAVINLEDGSVSEFRIHDLRHAFGTLAVEAGLPLEVVGGLLGHSQVSTTRRYAHIHDRILEAGVAKIAEHLRPRMIQEAAE